MRGIIELLTLAAGHNEAWRHAVLDLPQHALGGIGRGIDRAAVQLRTATEYDLQEGHTVGFVEDLAVGHGQVKKSVRIPPEVLIRAVHCNAAAACKRFCQRSQARQALGARRLLAGGKIAVELVARLREGKICAVIARKRLLRTRFGLAQAVEIGIGIHPRCKIVDPADFLPGEVVCGLGAQRDLILIRCNGVEIEGERAARLAQRAVERGNVLPASEAGQQPCAAFVVLCVAAQHHVQLRNARVGKAPAHLLRLRKCGKDLRCVPEEILLFVRAQHLHHRNL